MIYFSLGILILTLGAQLVLRFFVNKRGITRKNTRKDAEKKAEKTRNDKTRINADNYVEPFEIKRFSLFTFLFSLISIFFLLCYQSYEQFQIWSQNETAKFLLPPYRSITYFLFYIGTRFFAPYLISLIAGLIFLVAAKILNKKYQERFFYPEEPYFGALALFLVGHPGWLFYLILLLFIYLMLHLSFVISQWSKVKSNRISLYYLWLSTAIFVIIIQKWLQALPIWQTLKM